MPEPATRRSPLERFLSLFTEVHAGEAATALLLSLNVFLILVAYYIIKPIREALILASDRGAEIKSYASVGQAFLLLLVAVPLYAALASRLPRRRLLNAVNLFFIANLVLFYLAIVTTGGGTVLGLLFFLWVGIFNRVIPTQFWSLANDVYSPEEGKRLFVIVAFGASAGAVFGGLITRQLIGLLGVNELLLVSAGILLLATALTNVVESREHERRARHSSQEATQEEAPMSKEGAFRLVLGTRYLLLIGLLMLILNWVNTNGEFILGSTVAESVKHAAEQQLGLGASQEQLESFVKVGIGEFYANFFTGVNIIGLLVQLFLVSRILKYLGVRVALMILPAIALGGYTLLAMIPILSVIRWAKTAENATDYSLQNTVREALFLPMSREEKYKAKQATDAFFWRAGDVFSAGLVYVGLNWISLSTKGFALVNMGLVIVWIFLALAIGREYQRRTAAPQD